MRTVLGTTTALSLAAAAPLGAQTAEPHEWGAKNAPMFEPAWPTQTRAPLTQTDVSLETRTIAEGLEHPWAVAALPEGGFLVTERPGRLVHVTEDGTVSEPIAGIPEVENRPPPQGGAVQAGLLDVKPGPDFEQDRHVYLTYSKPVGEEGSATAVARGVLSDDMTALSDVEDIWVQDPPSDKRMHYGSRIVFDDHGHAFITTGEHSSHETRDFAQHLDKTYGKIIRVNLDGSIPETNPFVGNDRADDAIWSYGHRNVQGAAMHDGTLYTVEHGPAGGDEVNIPLPAQNYGWPIAAYGVRYDGPHIGTGEARWAGFQEPTYYWDPVIAPSDAAFHAGEAFAEWNDDMLVGALVAPGIVRLGLQGSLVTEEERLLTEYGRVRDIEVLDDGTFVIATDYAEGELVHVTPANTQ